jgi:hyperosmotically inducible periplasmic protein
MRTYLVPALIAWLGVVGCSDKKPTATSMRTPATPAAGLSGDRLAREVRHEMVMLPYYGVFDNLAYRVDGNTVTLFGQVTRPTLKSDAENVVKRIEGVDRVIDNIEVLPPSPEDDRIRVALYRAIYGFSSLNRYALAAVPSIHIIVKNGRATLTGVVDNEGDKNAAGLQANGVPGVFAVDNELQMAR